MDIAREKAALRIRLRGDLAAVMRDSLPESDNALFAKLCTLPEFRAARTFFLFLGVGAEPNTTLLIQALLKAKLRVCIPRTLPDGNMEPCLITDLNGLLPGPLGIPNPPADAPVLPLSEIEFTLVPALCYDRRGYRLGQGGGYYDRFLARYRGPSGGLCREALLQTALPIEAHDRRVDAVITENEIIRTEYAEPAAEAALSDWQEGIVSPPRPVTRASAPPEEPPPRKETPRRETPEREKPPEYKKAPERPEKPPEREEPPVRKNRPPPPAPTRGAPSLEKEPRPAPPDTPAARSDAPPAPRVVKIIQLDEFEEDLETGASDMPYDDNRFSGEANTDEVRRRSAAPRRGRGARRSGCVTGIIYFAFVVGISLLLAAGGWIAANDVLALNKAEATAVITVEKDDSVRDVSKQLKEEGIINYASLFRLYGLISKAENTIVPGTYELSSHLDYRAIVSAMGSKSTERVEVTLTIPEGYTLTQIFRLLDESGVCTYADLMETAASHDYNFSFLKDLPLGDAHRLEGYLYPDTYNFYLGQNPLYAINKMLVNFDARVTNAMRDQAFQLGYSVHEIVIIASMIERETDGNDQANIASVIFNRMNSPQFSLLQIDATVHYALGGEWKEALSYADLEVDSPYNTYKYPGLPAGPIANPGYASIYAALNPAKTSYYYYALDQDGTHRFFQTHDGFQNFIG